MKQKSKRTKTRRSPHGGGVADRSFSALLKESALGAAAALGIAAVLLFLGAAVCCATADPNRLITPVGLITLALSSFLGGLIATAQSRSQALFHGLICGILLAVFFWFLTLFLKGSPAEGFSVGTSLALRGLTVAASILGAFLGMKKSAKPRHRRSS